MTAGAAAAGSKLYDDLLIWSPDHEKQPRGRGILPPARSGGGSVLVEKNIKRKIIKIALDNQD
jgi:hypothetical protein